MNDRIARSPKIGTFYEKGLGWTHRATMDIRTKKKSVCTAKTSRFAIRRAVIDALVFDLKVTDV